MEQLIAWRVTNDTHKGKTSIYQFSAIEQQMYDSISYAMNSQQDSVSLPSTSAKKILSIYNKVISENRNGYLYKPGTISVTTTSTETTLHMEMCREAGNRIFFDRQVKFATEKIITMALKERTGYNKVLSVYRYFVQNFAYAQQNTEKEAYHMTAGPFLYKEAVCEGFALAFSYVMNRLGIPCGIITGYSALNGPNGPHAWNILQIENHYYHIDVTWDICTKEKGMFDYFLIDDVLIRRDHYWNDSNIPHCVDASKDFYAKERLICRSESEIIQLLQNKIRLRKGLIGFRYIGSYTENVIKSDFLLHILTVAMCQCGCIYSKVNYGYNARAGTAYFNVIY